MPPQGWFNYLDHDLRVRVRMTTDSLGAVLLFTLQLEIWLNDRWLPIVRYDTAHGEAHIDYLNPTGTTYDKVWLGQRSPFNAAFTLAEDELKRDAEHHRSRFLEQWRGVIIDET
jgi:hypothetical protein